MVGIIRGRGVWRHGGGDSGSQPGGEHHLTRQGGGPKIFVRGGIEGGTQTKNFSNFREGSKFCILQVHIKILGRLRRPGGETVLHKGVHQGGKWFLDLQGGSFPPPTPTYGFRNAS